MGTSKMAQHTGGLAMQMWQTELDPWNPQKCGKRTNSLMLSSDHTCTVSCMCS